MTVDELLARARAMLPHRPAPAEALQAQADGALLVDIRGDDQRRDGLIPGAIVVPRNSLEWRCDPASDWRHPAIARRDLTIILVCGQGYQSSLAAATLQQLGLVHATDLDGGFSAWAAAGLPVIPAPTAGQDTFGNPSPLQITTLRRQSHTRAPNAVLPAEMPGRRSTAGCIRGYLGVWPASCLATTRRDAVTRSRRITALANLEEETRMITGLRRIALICALTLLAIPAAAAAAAGTPAAPPHRVLGSETLTQFKVTLVATAGTGTQSAKATVTAVAYQYVGGVWKKAATKTIGQVNQWYWTIVGVCSLLASQPFDMIKVSLLDSPASGQCSNIYTKRWSNG